MAAQDTEWDGFIAVHPEGHHEQSSGYARRAEAFGFRCERTVLREAGRIVAGAQLLVRDTALGRLARILRAPLAEAQDPQLLSRLVENLCCHARASRYTMVRVDTLPTQQEAVRLLGAAGFCAGVEPMLSCVVALHGSRDAMLASMHYNVRRYGDRETRQQVVVRRTGIEGLAQFYELYRMTATHHGFPYFPPDYFQYLWQLLAPSARLQCYVATWQGQPVAAVLNTVAGGRMYYGWGGMHRGESQARLKANYVLHLAAIDDAREQGLTHYDLTGTSPFKRQFALEPVAWPRPLRAWYGAAGPLRRQVHDALQSSALLRRLGNRAAARLGMRVRMPA